MGHVNFTEFRANMAAHLDRVEDDHVELVVTRQNRGSVVIVSLSDWEGMQETLHLLSTPDNAANLRASIAEYEAGKLVERDLIEP